MHLKIEIEPLTNSAELFGSTKINTQTMTIQYVYQGYATVYSADQTIKLKGKHVSRLDVVNRNDKSLMASQTQSFFLP